MRSIGMPLVLRCVLCVRCLGVGPKGTLAVRAAGVGGALNYKRSACAGGCNARWVQSRCCDEFVASVVCHIAR